MNCPIESNEIKNLAFLQDFLFSVFKPPPSFSGRGEGVLF